jgi:hypothetical protein
MNIFQDATKSVPTKDAQIVRVDMEQLDIGGRKSHLPSEGKSSEMSVSHVGSSASSGR